MSEALNVLNVAKWSISLGTELKFTRNEFKHSLTILILNDSDYLICLLIVTLEVKQA